MPESGAEDERPHSAATKKRPFAADHLKSVDLRAHPGGLTRTESHPILASESRSRPLTFVFLIDSPVQGKRGHSFARVQPNDGESVTPLSGACRRTQYSGKIAGEGVQRQGRGKKFVKSLTKHHSRLRAKWRGRDFGEIAGFNN